MVRLSQGDQGGCLTCEVIIPRRCPLFDPEVPTATENCGSCVWWCMSEGRCIVQEDVVKLMAQAEHERKLKEKGGLKYEQLSWWGDDQTS